MRGKWFLVLILLLYTVFSTGCTAASTSDFRFTGDGSQLLIQEDEVPFSSKSAELRRNPIRAANDWTVTYKNTPRPFGLTGQIIHGITVFNREEDAIKFLEAMYQTQLQLSAESLSLDRAAREDFLPPRKYAYKSPLADQFEVVYAPEGGKTRPVVGYEYGVLARYGNVVSSFVTVVEDEAQTGIKAEEANVLPWAEVERMLKLIDQKFADAGKQAN
jgi:hypothetical protein